MCSRQAVSKRLLRSYTAAFLDGISWSASRSSLPKNELESASPPPKYSPKNGTVFGALAIRAILESYRQAPKMGLNSGPVFGPTFSPFFFECIYCFFCKTSTKLPKSRFLVSSQGSLKICTRGDNDSNNIVLTMNFFRHSGDPSNTWQKISTIFGPRKRVRGRHRKFERQTCQAFPKTTRTVVKHTKTVASLCGKWEIELETQTFERKFGDR